jgi:hypothetical protein
MTYKLIKTDNYLLVVDDSEIKVGDYFYSIREILEQAIIDYPKNEHHDVILAHLPLNGSPILEGVDLLPPLEDDIERLAEIFGNNIGGNEAESIVLSFGYKKGYNKAREKYKYTEEDIRKALLIKHDGLDADYVIEVISNKYPTEFDCDMVGVIEHKDGLVISQYEIPKTITTSQGVQWVGKYK